MDLFGIFYLEKVYIFVGILIWSSFRTNNSLDKLHIKLREIEARLDDTDRDFRELEKGDVEYRVTDLENKIDDLRGVGKGSNF